MAEVAATPGRPGSGPLDVLLVDDDDLFRDAASHLLRRNGLRVRSAPDLEGARRHLVAALPLLVVDERLPDGSGLSLVRELREAGHPARVLVVTGHPELPKAVEALRLRIDDYLTKPVEPEELRLSVLRSLETARLERVERLALRRDDAERQSARLVGASLDEVRRLVWLAASAESPVLITGETGTGKGLVAASIHFAGQPAGALARPGEPSRERPLVKVNCAAIPESLIEAELFGVAKGAYTGAGESREGLFELADRGTLFLDEVGELYPAVQAKLLAVLEDGAARRVGGSQPRSFSVRVLAATNVDPELAVAAGSFRQDLFYRLNVLRIHVPPLRRRLGDLPELVEALLANHPGGSQATLAEGELERLAEYRWPGNVRELGNVLERALLLDDPQNLRPSTLLPSGQDVGQMDAANTPGAKPLEPLAGVEKRHILDTLERCDGNRSRTAETLGIGVATLYRRLRAYGEDEAG